MRVLTLFCGLTQEAQSNNYNIDRITYTFSRIVDTIARMMKIAADSGVLRFVGASNLPPPFMAAEWFDLEERIAQLLRFVHNALYYDRFMPMFGAARVLRKVEQLSMNLQRRTNIVMFGKGGGNSVIFYNMNSILETRSIEYLEVKYVFLNSF